ncbi:MAG: inositol monophosphatase, partial [bacterium]|nr:inositol monophosphatase [bacterium]
MDIIEKSYNLINESILIAKDIHSSIKKNFKIMSKGHLNLVTDVDIKIESEICNFIKKKMPKSYFVSEETSKTLKKRKYLWYIDPIDGTNNFVKDIPHYSLSIAFSYDGVILAGAIYDYAKDEVFIAKKNCGSYLNGKRIYVSRTKSLKVSIIGTGFPYDTYMNAHYYMKYFEEVSKHVLTVRRMGAASLDLAYVACGRFDGFWEFKLNPWDVAAGILLIEESGGV